MIDGRWHDARNKLSPNAQNNAARHETSAMRTVRLPVLENVEDPIVTAPPVKTEPPLPLADEPEKELPLMRATADADGTATDPPSADALHDAKVVADKTTAPLPSTQPPLPCRLVDAKKDDEAILSAPMARRQPPSPVAAQPLKVEVSTRAAPTLKTAPPAVTADEPAKTLLLTDTEDPPQRDPPLPWHVVLVKLLAEHHRSATENTAPPSWRRESAERRVGHCAPGSTLRHGVSADMSRSAEFRVARAQCLTSALKVLENALELIFAVPLLYTAPPGPWKTQKLLRLAHFLHSAVAVLAKARL